MTESKAYILTIALKESSTIQIGKLGRFHFKKGSYYYVGSAKKGIAQRVNRHLRSKVKHWHIDYLKAKTEITDALIITEPDLGECDISSILSEEYIVPVKGFGSSDCGCESHLFFHPKIQGGVKVLVAYLKSRRIDFTFFEI